MSALLRDTRFERAHMWIGHATSDRDWIDNQWASIEPETYAKVAEAIADHDTAQAGEIIKAAIKRIAYREAEAKFGVTLP